MKRSLVVRAFAAAMSLVAFATPVSAHGDHDARPLARHVPAGPYSVSLWQVYPDIGQAMTPHLIVMFDDVAALPAATVRVAVNSVPMEAGPSITTSTGWETSEGIAEGDVVSVTIAEGAQEWPLDPLVVPPSPISMLPIQELLYASIFLTFATAAWVAGRTARVWRRPTVQAS